MVQTRHRAIFISDVHLGARGAQVAAPARFSSAARGRHDLSGRRHRRRLAAASAGWHWPQSHNDVVQKLLRKVPQGQRASSTCPATTTSSCATTCGTHFGGIEVMDQTVHEAADGKRFLVIHGDAFDVVVMHARWLAHLGDWAYDAALYCNRWVNVVRRRLGLTYWSLSAWAKLKVKKAVNFIGAFEEALASEARRQRVDGVICGHIHHAVIKDQLGIRYMNCGDWVESCTALVEDHDGRFEILRWTTVKATAPELAPVEDEAIDISLGIPERPSVRV
jgi:UDP-2,3-diacylglucosamine pyrophosphatase LpxH